MTAHLQAGAVLAEGRLHLQLLLDRSVGGGGTVALHLSGTAKGALQPPRRVFYVLQLPLEAVKLRLALQKY